MIGKTLLGLFLAIGLSAMPAFAETDTPYKQFQSGIALEEIQCRDSKTLMETTRGTPACVSADSVQELRQKGWTAVRQQGHPDMPSEPHAKTITTRNTDEPLMAYSGLGFSWPQYSVTFPEQVRIGEQFEVVIDYTFIIPVLDDDEHGVEFLSYEESERYCTEECLERIEWLGSKFYIDRNVYVDLINATDYVFKRQGNDTRHLPIRGFEYGTIPPILNGTHPQQKTLTFAINEPDTEYPFGEISIGFAGDMGGWIYFYVEPDNTVRLSDEPIVVEDEGIPRLGLNIPDRPPRAPLEDPLSGVSNPEELMHDLAAFFEVLYPEVSAEDEMRQANFPEKFIDKFFGLYPDLRIQSHAPTLQFILPSAHAQPSPTSFVYGNAYYYDIAMIRSL